ncbi:MAG: carbohydrate ABC transporter permease, partial [Candidatus Microbacterium stercoravium]
MTNVTTATVPIKFRTKGRRMTPGRRVFAVINGIVLTAFALICVLPFINVLASSLATPGEIATTPFILFPKTFTLDAYRYILSTPTIFRARGVSVFVTAVGTFLSLVLTSFMAYALSKKHLRGRRVINFLVVFTMLFSGGMIPTFMVVNAFGLIDSLWSLILPVAINAFNFVIMRSF